MPLPPDAHLALLAAIVDSSDDAIVSKSLDGVITSWNQSAERLFGYTAEEAVGRHVTMLIPPDRLNEEPKILARIRQGERVEHFETVRRRKNGTMLDISLTISPVRNTAGAIVGASKIARDITESKKMVAELQRSNAVLQQFAYSASHDLQEPLRTVKIYAELLMQRHAGQLDAEGLTLLGRLQRGANRMQTLLCDLLAYARVTDFERPTESSDAALALQNALQNLANRISESQAEVTAHPLPKVRAHFAHLEQLFQNLIGNAIKYHRAGVPPIVVVRAERDMDVWHFSVQDNGIGIAPEYQDTVFQLFKRLHRAEEYSGAGMGLAICQRIVEQYDGRIWVESEPGSGSTFKFTLPD